MNDFKIILFSISLDLSGFCFHFYENCLVAGEVKLFHTCSTAKIALSFYYY